MNASTGRVLVADDDRGVRESVSEILERFGYSVTEAEDGQDALEKLAAGHVDAVVLDVKMPRRDGLEVLEEMMPQPPPPGVVLVTAYDVGPEIRVLLANRVTKV
ncbi:MAG: response regulator, partial [Gemmatimonadales bacterium]